MANSKNKIPLVNKNQELQEVYKIELEALNFLNKAVERLAQRIDEIEARFVVLERKVDSE